MEVWPAVGSEQRDLVMDAATPTGKADGWSNKMRKRLLFQSSNRWLRLALKPVGIRVILQDIRRINLRSSKYEGNGFSPFYSCCHIRQSNACPAETSGNEFCHCRDEDSANKLNQSGEDFSRWQSFPVFLCANGSVHLARLL